jgi:hypothetical protein
VSNRVRLSTVALAVVFAGVLALYVEVRPPPVSVAGDVTVESTTAPERTRSRSPSPTPTGTRTPSPTAATEPSPTPGPTPGAGEPRLTPTAEPTSIPGTGSP